jgi:hypothetical protein
VRVSATSCLPLPTSGFLGQSRRTAPVTKRELSDALRSVYLSFIGERRFFGLERGQEAFHCRADCRHGSSIVELGIHQHACIDERGM